MPTDKTDVLLLNVLNVDLDLPCSQHGQKEYGTLLCQDRRSLSYPNLITKNMKTYIKFKQHKNI